MGGRFAWSDVPWKTVPKEGNQVSPGGVRNRRAYVFVWVDMYWSHTGKAEMCFAKGNKISAANTGWCKRVYLLLPSSASLYGCNVLYGFSVYSDWGLALPLERHNAHSGRSDFPTPKVKGGSKLAKSPAWEQRAHLSQASVQRCCSNKDFPK